MNKRLNFSDAPAGVEALLLEYRARKKIYDTDKITFAGVGGNDVYNISRPFPSNGKTYIAGRVEPRDSEIGKVLFFARERGNLYTLVPDTEIDMLQDPCVTVLADGSAVIGGTKIFMNDSGGISSWATAFYKGDGIFGLREFARAPMHMKDVRFVPFNDGTAVFTRPQGGRFGYGKIGFLTLASPEQITPEALTAAEVFDCHFRS
ncbi:MAG: DUF1861 family protein, partial [Clostridiales bacterium]|nr:DUF1861 family protein [Clostridiales bacterium]